MEFINFLDKIEMEIIRIVEKAEYSIEENTSLCLSSEEYAGFLKKSEKIIVICTDNAKKKEGYTVLVNKSFDTFERTARHIKKALRHEAVHVAQECNNGNLLNINQKFSINKSKYKAIIESSKVSGDEKKEIQAYILEDKPKMLKKELEKYCL